MEKKISFYRNFGSVGEEVSLEYMLGAIKEGAYRKQIEALRQLNEEDYGEQKKKLPHFTPSGTFNKHRRMEELKEYSQVIILDIDKVDEHAETIRDKTAKIGHTLASFVSPSGRGVKILVNTASTRENHEQTFKEVVSFYEKELEVEVDISGKDVSRACFVSYDPDLYLNKNSEVFEVQTITEIPAFNTVSTTQLNEFEVFQKAIAYTQKLQSYYKSKRNVFVHLLACNCNRYGLKEKTTIDLVLEHYDLEPERAIPTIRSAYKNIQEHGKSDIVSSKTDELIEFSNPVSTLFSPLFSSIEYYDGLPEPKYIWNGIVEGSFGYIFGAAGVGKTICCENLGISIAAGSDSFLGVPLDNSIRRNVLFIAMEEYGQFSRKRNKKQVEYLGLLSTDDFVFNVSTENFPEYFSTQEDWDKLEKVIQESEAEVVFIDSMTRATEGPIEESGTSRKVSIKLRTIANKHNITLIVIHHSTKLHGNRITQDSMAGSRVISQEADFLYAINMTDNVRYIKEVKCRYKPLNDKVTIFKINDCAWLEKVKETHENYIVVAQDSRENPSNDQLITEAIEELKGNTSSQVETKRVFENVSDNIGRSEFYRRLKRLSETGKINQERGYVSIP